jgi:Tol biopolymer transport system component
MIEITHQQARRIIHASIDARADGGVLPEVQWSAVQAHLEACSDCRAYRQRLELLEKDIRRSLLAVWSPVPGPETNTGQSVLEWIQRRSQRKRRFLLTALSVVMLFTLALLAVLFDVGKLLSRTGETATAGQWAGSLINPQPSPLPTIQLGDFNDVVVFESRKDGNSEIYLLNPGGEAVNLTNSPAQESHPTWSPDGEWIAFLSNRTGKQEIFVMGLAGNRVIQISSEPGIDWQGPLSWSADGQWIALTGLRMNQGSQAWVYLVPVEGDRSGSAGPIAVEGSRGGWAPEFSPDSRRLAYATWDGVRAGIVILEQETGQQFSANWEGGSEERLRAGISLDWSLDGTGFVYIAGNQVGGGGEMADPTRSLVIVLRELNSSFEKQTNSPNFSRVAESGWPVAFLSVTWNLAGSVIYLEDLDDARANDLPGSTPGACWTLQIRQPGITSRRGQPSLPNDLCIESGLHRQSWTPDGSWLVVRARQPGEFTQSLYAIRVPGWWPDSDARGREDITPAVSILRLTGRDHPFEKWPGVLLASLPQVRPQMQAFKTALPIEPQPVQVKRAEVPTAVRDEAGGQVAFALDKNAVSVLARANPDGTGGFVLAATTSKNRCPVWSPDGRQLAFLSSRVSAVAGDDSGDGEGVYRMNANGLGLAAIVEPFDASITDPLIYSGCPVWSPNGRHVALIARRGGQHLLMIAPVGNSNGLAPRWLKIGTPSAGPAWTPDSRQVLLAYPQQEWQFAQVFTISVDDDNSSGAEPAPINMPFRRGPVYGLATSPDAMQAAILSTISLSNLRRIVVLRLADLTEGGERVQVRLSEEPDLQDGQPPGELHWLADGHIGLILYGPANGLYKTLILRFDPSLRIVEPLASVEDRLYSAAWSPDGAWLIYSTESGLWLLDVAGARTSEAVPLWISPEPVYDLNWENQPFLEISASTVTFSV